MTTPKPPYVFPQQSPTAESVDEDGEILRRITYDSGSEYLWRSPVDLVDGDLWVPGCDAFFEEWASELRCDGPNTRAIHADKNWLKAPGES